MRSRRAVVAQLDRATGYELVGWGFESLRPRFPRLFLVRDHQQMAVRIVENVVEVPQVIEAHEDVATGERAGFARGWILIDDRTENQRVDMSAAIGFVTADAADLGMRLEITHVAVINEHP